MPIYEYKCKKCDNEFEELVRASNRDDGIQCPDCGSASTERLMSACRIGSSNSSSSSSSSACATCSADSCASCNL